MGRLVWAKADTPSPPQPPHRTPDTPGGRRDEDATTAGRGRDAAMATGSRIQMEGRYPTQRGGRNKLGGAGSKGADRGRPNRPQRGRGLLTGRRGPTLRVTLVGLAGVVLRRCSADLRRHRLFDAANHNQGEKRWSDSRNSNCGWCSGLLGGGCWPLPLSIWYLAGSHGPGLGTLFGSWRCRSSASA